MAQPNIPYREGGAHGGLPFPRKSMTAYTVATALAAASGLVCPLFLLARSPANIFSNMKDGGPSMWLLLMLVPAIPLLVAILSGLAIRGRRIPPIAIVGFAAFPALVAFAGTTMSLGRMNAALSGVSIDPSQAMRIAFEGTQEALGPLQFGGALCAFALGAAAIGCAGIAASVDRARVGAKVGSTWLVSLVAPVVGLFASVIVMFVTRSLSASLYAFGLSLVSMGIVAVIAPLTALASPAFRDWHDVAEQKRMLSAVICAAVAASLALWLLDRTAMLGIERLVLGACSGESVDPSQRGRILMEGRFESRAFGMLSALHVPSVLLAFAPALIRGMSKGRSPFGASGVIALVLGAAVGLGFYGVESHATGMIGKIAAATPERTFPVALPTVHDVDGLRTPTGPLTVVDKNGKLVGARASDWRGELSQYAADKGAPVTAVFVLAASAGGGHSSDAPMDLVVRPDTPELVSVAAIDPDLAALIRPEPWMLSAKVNLTTPASRRPSITFTSDDTVIARSERGEPTTVTFGHHFKLQLQTALGYPTGDIYVNVLETTTVGAFVTVLDAMRLPYGTSEVYAGPVRSGVPAALPRSRD